MRRVLLYMLLYASLALAVTTRELEKWIDEVNSYSQLALFYNEDAITWGHSDIEPPKVPSASFIDYCKRIVRHKKPLETLLLKRYREKGELHAAKLYVVLGNPSRSFLDPIWKKGGTQKSYGEDGLIELAGIYHPNVMKPYLKELFSVYPADHYNYNLRHRLLQGMLPVQVDSILIRYAIQTDLSLLHHVKDSTVLPLLVQEASQVQNSAQRSDILKAIVKQLKLFPESYALFAKSSLANAKDIEEMIGYSLEKKKRSHYKRAVPKVLVSLSLNFGDSIHLKNAGIVFGQVCHYRNPDSMTIREKEQTEVLYRETRGYGLDGIPLKKQERLQAWQNWLCAIDPDSEIMWLRLITDMRKLKLSETFIYNHLKRSEKIEENKVLVDSLLKGYCDTAFVNMVISKAHHLSEKHYYNIFNNATSKYRIDACGESLVRAVPTLDVKQRITYMYYIVKATKHNSLWDTLVREKLYSIAKEKKREKVALNMYAYNLYLFSMSDMGEEELLALLNIFRRIPEGEESQLCIKALYNTFIAAIGKNHHKGDLTMMYRRVLAMTHDKVSHRKDLQQFADTISRYKPVRIFW